MIMLLKLAIAAGILYGFAWTQLFYAPTCVLWFSGLIQGFVFGLISGDMATAMILGGSITLLSISQVASGGIQPSDLCLASCIAIPVALVTGMSTAMALTLSIAVGLLGNLLSTLNYSICNIFPHMVDKYAAEGNLKGIRTTTILAAIVMFAIGFAASFIPVFFGTELVDSLVNAMPEWLLNGLDVAGGILPAIGVMLTLKVIDRPKLIPLFIIGYYVVSLLGLSVVGAAIIAICAILVIFSFRGLSEKNQTEV